MTQDFVMTAAQCVEHYPSVFVEAVIVRLGSIYKDHGGQDFSVKEVRVHGGEFKFFTVDILITVHKTKNFLRETQINVC